MAVMQQSDFLSKGVRCDGTLYLPEDVARPPVIVMAHGMAAEKGFRLPAYARWFAGQGLAVLLFDYRTFGKSDGTPRHIVDPALQVQDWRAAIAHARDLPFVDGSRLALWGTSFAGGHVVTCAAADHRIAAVVSQIPFVSGPSSIQGKKATDILLSTLYGLYDSCRSFLGLTPLYVPVIAEPGRFAVMNTADAVENYRSLVPPDSTWENKIAARSLLRISLYSPLDKARRVRAKTLVMAARNDSLIPIRAVEKMAGRIPDCALEVVDCKHFEPYTDDLFEQFVTRQTRFLKEVLQGQGEDQSG